MSLKRDQENIWSRSNQEKAESYFNLPKNVKRSKYFSEFLDVHVNKKKIESVFEIGLMGGRNVDSIVQRFGIKNYGGIDISEDGVIYAQEKMPDGKFEHCSVYDMDTDEKFDLVFTMGVMIHIPPDGIDEAIDKCVQKSNKLVVHVEGMGRDAVHKGPKESNPQNKIANRFQWMPNLEQRYKDLGFKTTMTKLPPKVSHSRDVTHILVVKI